MRRAIIVGYVAACAILCFWLYLPLLFGGHLNVDLTFMWAGARASHPYDIWAVTRAQAAFRETTLPQAFVYPPSSLPLFFPFGLLRFWWAFAVWTALSVALFWLAARKITKHASLSFVSPYVIMSITLGQTPLLTGSAAMWGISLLRLQPVLAGACLGLGLALKPQCLMLAPVALVSGRHWRAIFGMGLVWLMLALPTATFWPDWWRLVQAFPAILARFYPGLTQGGATPSSWARALGLPVLPIEIIGMALGIWIVWVVFRSKTDDATRVIGLVTGTLLASPYAIRYELAALAPAYLAVLSRGRLRDLLTALPMLCLTVFFVVPALLLSAATMILPHLFDRRRDTPAESSPTRHGSATKSTI